MKDFEYMKDFDAVTVLWFKLHAKYNSEYYFIKPTNIK